MNNLQFYSCARSQHAHAIRINWLNIITMCIVLYFCSFTKEHEKEEFNIIHSVIQIPILVSVKFSLMTDRDV